MAQIGILGTGRMAVRLARILLDNGHRVILGSRTPSRASTLARVLDAARCAGGSYEDAARAPVVLPAIFIRDGLFDVLEALRVPLAGKLLIDIANPFNADYTGFTLPWDTSASEQLQLRFPANRVVGIFKNVFSEAFENPHFREGVSDVYVVGEDAQAKREVTALFTPSSFRFVDAGGLVNARIVERMTLFAMELGARMGYLPRVGWKLLGEPWEPGKRDVWAKALATAT
ncbi:MAG: dinucleotide-binding enzyme [Betaproteobacteria bacterium]|nr:MAG: dinucleotide-binding enzyme [Betaproteobacteria bacterium]